MKVVLGKEFFFEAAHRRLTGEAPVCRLHGHSYRLELLAEGEVVAKEGWLVDYGDLKSLIEPIYSQLDHAYLNELPNIGDPSLANVKRWIETAISDVPDWFSGVGLSIVGDGVFTPRQTEPEPEMGLQQRLRFTFEAAQSLPHLPDGHPCRQLHGHSYRIQVGASDLERLEPVLSALYDTLDHQYLNDIPGLDTATCERMAAWMWRWLHDRVDDVTVVVVQETGTARCIYHGQ